MKYKAISGYLSETDISYTSIIDNISIYQYIEKEKRNYIFIHIYSQN